jgi:hypothetical protein
VQFQQSRIWSISDTTRHGDSLMVEPLQALTQHRAVLRVEQARRDVHRPDGVVAEYMPVVCEVMDCAKRVGLNNV